MDREEENPISLVRLMTGIDTAPMRLTKGKSGRSSDK